MIGPEYPTLLPCEKCGGMGCVRSEEGWTKCTYCTPDGGASDLTGLTKAIGLELNPTNGDKDPLQGSRIGDVTILCPIAEGGMGRVYEAVQDKPRRAVAVKIVRPGYASPDLTSRFERESEVLGSLDHEYIAHVYRAGFYDCKGGRLPYFIMQYIPDALPVTVYANKHAKSQSERLILFRKACDAVAYAHSRTPSVVHRDLKPSNILVDGRGNPKVIDFGIARCVSMSTADDNGLTVTGQVMGTPQYMSPEQFKGDRSAIDSRSDVWALGMILHELMLGTLPYDVRQLSGFEAAQVVWQFRPTWNAGVKVRLGTQLLAIIEKCLQQDRAARFADAGALRDAVANVRVDASSVAVDASSFNATNSSTTQLRLNRTTFVLVACAAAVIIALGLIAFRWQMGDRVRPTQNRTASGEQHTAEESNKLGSSEPLAAMNVVENSSFESGLDPWLTREATLIANDARAARTGDACCLLLNKSWYAGLYQYIWLSWGDRVTVRFWAETSLPLDGSGGEILLFDRTRARVSDVYYAAPIRKTTEQGGWARYETTIQMPDKLPGVELSSSKVGLAIFMRGAKPMRIDDIEIYVQRASAEPADAL